MTTATLAWLTAMRARRAGAGAPPPPPPPPTGLTPVWGMEYVNVAGNMVYTPIAADGSTHITVRRYANSTIDAIESRSIAPGCDTAIGAAQLMGFGVDYGENTGRTWPTTGLSRDLDYGEPVFHHDWDVEGEHTVLLYEIDPEGRTSTISFTVEVLPLGTVTDITSNGAWPTLQNFGVYGLQAGGDYRSWGDFITDDLVGVRLVKLGEGADPLIGAFIPDSRGLTSTALTTRARDCVIVGMDYEDFRTGLIGASYCGSVGGHCRLTTWSALPHRYYFEHAGIAANDRNQADNIRFPRGCFVVDGGIVGSGGGQYCIIGGGRSINFSGTAFCRTSGDTGGNPMRIYFDKTVLRNMQVWSTTPTFGWIKGSLFPCVYAATPSDAWPDNDSFGDFDTSRALYLANGNSTDHAGNWGVGGRYFWVSDSLFGGSGMTSPPTYLGGWNPQNNDAPSTGTTGPWTAEDCFESGEIGGFERNRLTYDADAALTLSGRGLSARDNLRSAGGSITVTTNSNPNRTHPDYLGPYYSNPRPVHPAFA